MDEVESSAHNFPISQERIPTSPDNFFMPPRDEAVSSSAHNSPFSQGEISTSDIFGRLTSNPSSKEHSLFLGAERRTDPWLLSCLRMLAATPEAETDGAQREAINMEANVSFIVDVVQ
eukprot:scaffold15259_cov69-Cyclotella_meneghiniana.AAC.2